MTEIDTMTGEEFHLFESHAIMKYLSNTRNLGDNWYP